jgi:hypothetical protein
MIAESLKLKTPSREALGAVRSQPETEGRPSGVHPKLEAEDGTPAAPNWKAGDTIPLGGRTLRVIDTRLDESTDGDPVSVLVVEPM